MLRPAHFLSTAVLAAFAIPLLDAMPKAEQKSATAALAPMSINRVAVPAKTISNTGPLQTAEPQRWVF
jgi:hypothetical protein